MNSMQIEDVKLTYKVYIEYLHIISKHNSVATENKSINCYTSENYFQKVAVTTTVPA